MTTGNASEDEQALNDNWIPNSAYNLAHGFKQQHGDELTFELVNEMLKDLNRIYRERERKQVQRVKQQSQEEINKLKRKLTYRPTYDEVGARKNKQTLKRQITALTSELEQLQGRKKQALALQNTPAGVEMVQNNLIMVTKMQQQRKEMEAENAQLKHNLTRITQAGYGSETHDKQKYMEGAVWMGKRMSGEVERICKVFETLMQDYKKRFAEFEQAYNEENENAQRLSRKGLSQENEDLVLDHINADKKQREMELLQLQRAQVWFLEAIQQTTVDMYERIVVMLESALFHQNEASSILQDAYTPVRKN